MVCPFVSICLLCDSICLSLVLSLSICQDWPAHQRCHYSHAVINGPVISIKIPPDFSYPAQAVAAHKQITGCSTAEMFTFDSLHTNTSSYVLYEICRRLTFHVAVCHSLTPDARLHRFKKCSIRLSVLFLLFAIYCRAKTDKGFSFTSAKNVTWLRLKVDPSSMCNVSKLENMPAGVSGGI